jgi:hypothetical protein
MKFKEQIKQNWNQFGMNKAGEATCTLGLKAQSSP